MFRFGVVRHILPQPWLEIDLVSLSESLELLWCFRAAEHTPSYPLSTRKLFVCGRDIGALKQRLYRELVEEPPRSDEVMG